MEHIPEGLELIQISYGKYDIQLHFIDDLHISSGYRMTYHSPQGYTTDADIGTVKVQICINELLGCTILATKISEKGMRLGFSNGGVLELHFEGHGDETVIVNWKSRISIFR